MSKVYIKKDDKGEFINLNLFNAYQGFKEFGSEIVFYTNIFEVLDNEPEDIIVGGIGDVRAVLDRFGFEYPILEYPDSLQPYLGRKLWKRHLGEIVNNPDKWNVFIKPVVGGKLFTGAVIKTITDLRAVSGVDPKTEIWCSEVVDFISEWRCFIRYGELINAKHYKGSWCFSPNIQTILNAAKDFENAPNAYVLDFGVTVKGETLLVEVNEGYSVGCYGLESTAYAKFLSARWSQLTNTVDDCNF